MSDPLQDRQVRRRLEVAMTCRYYGISRQCYYTWLRRFDADGPEGLRDRSQRPHHSPNATRIEVVEKIVHLRTTYHFGPMKIVMYLARYHDITISPSAVWRILKRLELNRLPASQRYQRRDRRWKRYEKAQPGHRVQIDVKFVEAIPAQADAAPSRSKTAPGEAGNPMSAPTRLAGRRRRRYYQFTAIDDCTRLRVLKIYPKADQKTAVAFLDHVLERLLFKIDVIQTDNGAEFQSSFHWHVTEKGIQHVYIKPRTPRLNGKVERSHRIDGDEFYRILDGVVIDDTKTFDDKLREWEDYYNYYRPHGGPGGQPL